MEAFDCRLLDTPSALQVVSQIDLRLIARRHPDWADVTNGVIYALVATDAVGVMVHRRGGWFLLELLEGGRLLRVLAANSPCRSVLIDAAKFLDELARALKVVRIVFQSDRPGFRKLAPRFGYNLGVDGYYSRNFGYYSRDLMAAS